MNFQTVASYKPASNSQGTWSLDGQLIPHPVCFGAISMTETLSTGALKTTNSEVLNAQVEGAYHGAKFASFMEQFTRWRLAYASVTIYQDGPDLANQGTVLVCQKPVEPMHLNVDTTSIGTVDGPMGVWAGNYGGLCPKAFHIMPDDKPNYTASQANPNAYFGKSKEGAYIPLKLTRTHQTWHSMRDVVYQCNSCADPLYTGTVRNTGKCGQTPLVLSDQVNTTGYLPFTTLNDLHVCVPVPLPGGSPTMSLAGDVTSDFCNENWADFSFRNLAVTTSLSFYFRFGFECQVQPTSILSPHLKLSPTADSAAVESYFAIARELKDAYPADYNDLEKIWGVISSIAKTVAPALLGVPDIGLILSPGVSAAAALGDSIVKKVVQKRKAKQNQVALTNTRIAPNKPLPKPPVKTIQSMADVERARLAIKRPQKPNDLQW